jgi:hypothetical protein
MKVANWGTVKSSSGQHLLADLVHRLGQQAQIGPAEELHLVEQQQHEIHCRGFAAGELQIPGGPVRCSVSASKTWLLV